MRTLSFPFVTHNKLQSVKIMNEIHLQHTSKFIPIYCTCPIRMTSSYVDMHIACYNILVPITMKICLKLNE